MNAKYLLVLGISILYCVVVEGASLRDSFLDFAEDEDDVDEIYDQRQKGDENIRLRINGVLLAIPVDLDGGDSGNYQGSSETSLSSLYQDYLDSLSQFAVTSSTNSPSLSSNDSPSNSSPPFGDSFLELLEYFPHKKRNSHKVQKEDTQARNKISPSSNFQSEKQLEDVELLKPKEIVKNQQKK